MIKNYFSNSYALVDSGHGRKLEQFGPYRISRPAAQAVWAPQLTGKEWQAANLHFTREPDNCWSPSTVRSTTWTIQTANLFFKLAPTDFGHLGIFPEQRPFWEWLTSFIQTASPFYPQPLKVLNLFAYSGGSTFACAKGGAQVCHLDASKGMVTWARENAHLNQLEQAPIRWIVDDVGKFLAREKKRGHRYDGIILDPPSFGRGNQGELFKIEEDIEKLLRECRELLSDQPLFILFSCHTPGFTPIAMSYLIHQMMTGCPGKIDQGEMTLTGQPTVFELPSGTYCRWQRDLST